MHGNDSSVLQSLIQLHKMGILSENELKLKVMQLTPVANTKMPAVCTPELPAVCTPELRTPKREVIRKSRKRKLATPDDIANEISARTEGTQPDLNPHVRPRPGKPTVNLSALRKIVKDPTRLRFFSQCRKADSVLWYRSPSGHQHIHKMLFARAAQDPMDEVYRQHPGPTRGVPVNKILSVIKWQVSKDRANWIGKTPKRQMLFGTESPFDWEGELQKLRSNNDPKVMDSTVVMASADLATSTMTIAPPKVIHTPIVSPKVMAPVVSPKVTIPKSVKTNNSIPSVELASDAPKPKNTIDVDCLKTCLTCGRAVWIGEKMELPDGVVLACPLGSDWTMDTVDPYCDACWDNEVRVLDELSLQHKGVGASKDKNQKKAKSKRATRQKATRKKATGQKATRKKATGQKTTRNKATRQQGKKQKKQLGGLSGPLSAISPPPVIRWQVYSRAHTHTDCN